MPLGFNQDFQCRKADKLDRSEACQTVVVGSGPIQMSHDVPQLRQIQHSRQLYPTCIFPHEIQRIHHILINSGLAPVVLVDRSWRANAKISLSSKRRLLGAATTAAFIEDRAKYRPQT